MHWASEHAHGLYRIVIYYFISGVLSVQNYHLQSGGPLCLPYRHLRGDVRRMIHSIEHRPMSPRKLIEILDNYL